jgi:hypothetical protein
MKAMGTRISLLRVLAPERIDAPRLENQPPIADVGLYLTVDIDTIAWYKASIGGGVK